MLEQRFYLDLYRKSLSSAMDMVNKGFSSKQQKKNALSYINSAYSNLEQFILNELLFHRSEISTKEEDKKRITDIYYSIPMNCHQFRIKHRDDLLSVLPNFSEEIEELYKTYLFRCEVNSMDVVSLVKNNQYSEFKEKINFSLKEKMEKLKIKYDNALSCAELFGGLPVTTNIHLCINQFGTRYIRAFFYLNGKLTPLSLIMVAMQGAKEKGFIK